MSARPGPPVARPLDVRVVEEEYWVVGPRERVVEVAVVVWVRRVLEPADPRVRAAVG